MILFGRTLNDDGAVKLDNPYNLIYCVILALWSTVFCEFWKRRQAEIAHSWNMTDFVEGEEEMPDYKADYIMDFKFRIARKTSLVNTYLRKTLAEPPLALLAAAVVVAFYIGFFKLVKYYDGNTAVAVPLDLAYSFLIVFLGHLYRAVASRVVKWENHKWKCDWEDSLITKNFAFAFLNAYIMLFGVAFAF